MEYEEIVIFYQYFGLSRKRYKIGLWLLWNASSNSYSIYRIVSSPMTLS